jgi:hypothetical protein
VRYASVQVQLWRHPKIKSLSRDARNLFVYLLTSPHSNMAGYYYLPLAYAVEDTGYPIDTVFDTLSILSEKHLVKYDVDTHVLLIRDYLEWNKPKGPKQVGGVIAAAKNTPKSLLLQEFIECAIHHAPDATDKWGGLMRYPIDTVPIAVISNQEEEEEEGRILSESWHSFYERVFVATVNPTQYQEVARLIAAGVKDDLVIAALQKAIDERKRNKFKYAIALITDMIPDGVRTAEDWRRLDTDRDTPIPTTNRFVKPAATPIDEFNWDKYRKDDAS